jgi:thiamine-monophosphate kinase
LTDRPEFDAIEAIRRRQPPDGRVAFGIGDDTALLWGGPADWLVTVDMILEHVHFRPGTPLDLVGRKSLAVNLSDLAAMAGRPVAALVAMGIPSGYSARQIDDVYRGIEDLAREFHVAIVGGDTNRSHAGLVISITLLGHPTGKGAVTRSGAQPGDILMVTGKLGGSLAGRHLSFQPRVEEACRLHELVGLHAMMDLSDGLAGDIFHLSKESRCGIIIDVNLLPIHDDVVPDGRSTLDHALHDGEDFELLFAVSPADADHLMSTQPLKPIPVSRIGEVVAGSEASMRQIDGSLSRLQPGGYVHRF